MSYASVNGLNMYYEVHGSGRPLVMLHGGFSCSETPISSGPSMRSRFFDSSAAASLAISTVSRAPGSPFSPGTTHITLVHRADWLLSMITEFLDAPTNSS